MTLTAVLIVFLDVDLVAPVDERQNSDDSTLEARKLLRLFCLATPQPRLFSAVLQSVIFKSHSVKIGLNESRHVNRASFLLLEVSRHGDGPK